MTLTQANCPQSTLSLERVHCCRPAVVSSLLTVVTRLLRVRNLPRSLSEIFGMDTTGTALCLERRELRQSSLCRSGEGELLLYCQSSSMRTPAARQLSVQRKISLQIYRLMKTT